MTDFVAQTAFDATAQAAIENMPKSIKDHRQDLEGDDSRFFFSSLWYELSLVDYCK